MAWNGQKGVPWSREELDVLSRERQKDPPTPYKDIAELLPGRTPGACHRAATDIALVDWNNSLTNRVKYKGKEREIFAAIQYCVLDRGMTGMQTRDYLDRVMGLNFARSTLAKRIAKYKDGTKEEKEVHRKAAVNAKRSRALRISITRKMKYRSGEYDHLKTRGKVYGNSRGEGEGQDKGDTQEVPLLLRTARHAGHGTERNA